MNSSIKETMLCIVIGYCKHNHKHHIPHCIMHLIFKHLSLYTKQRLFNFKYLGDNKTSDYSDWEGYLGRAQLTSILAGIKINLELSFDVKINIGGQFFMHISLKEATFKTNMDNHQQTIRSMTGNIWKFPKSKSITILVLMSKETSCACYNREGNQISIYLLKQNSAIKSIFGYYSDIWTRYPIPLKLRNDDTAEIIKRLNSNFSYDMNEDVSIECNGIIEKITNFNSLIPIGDCAQGWLCCYVAFD